MEPARPAPSRINLRRLVGLVAVWQLACFTGLIAFIWAAEVVDLKHLVYDTPAEPVDWLRASVLTAAVLTVAAVTIGQTHLQEKRILRGLIIVCSYCRKVRVEKDAWQQLEAYIAEKTSARFTHGVCPSCYEHQSAEIDAMKTVAGDAPAKELRP